ncbi:Na+/H+ antiporter [Variovorax sp. HJSM1_2]|uniref:Na+/H+ antiporter n=1 Tax=Variovorax sp. HJSM1_2 TaxID=3366263 RepID=UPI003BD2B9A7
MHPVQTFELLMVMLVAIIALHFLAHKFGLPPAVALLAGGSLLAFIPGAPTVSLDPELILVVFLPPLLMDGAWFTPLAHFRRHLVGICSLAVGAVIFTTAVVAVVTHWLVPSLPWAACAALGAIVSPPDAVSAKAVLQRVRLPKRLATLLEGESLLNDATGLVLFRFAVAAAISGSFSMLDAVGSFAVLTIGGVAVGAAIGALWVLLVRKLLDEYLIIAASVLTCWLAYIAGEMLHVSGVIATVTTGLVCGWFQHVVFSAHVRVRAVGFWTVFVFLLEALVFILIGSSLRGVVERMGGLGSIVEQMGLPILLIVLAMTLARLAWVYASDLLLLLLQRLGLTQKPSLGLKSATIVGWAGMRGVVTLAVALSLPEDMPGRDFMLISAFAVIFATVLIQGMTLGPLIRWLGVKEVEARHTRFSRSQAEAAVAQAQLATVERHAYAEDGGLLHPKLLAQYQRQASAAANYSGNEEHYAADVQAHFNVVLAAIAAGRLELIRLHRAGEIDDETLHALEHDLDLEEISAVAAKS